MSDLWFEIATVIETWHIHAVPGDRGITSRSLEPQWYLRLRRGTRDALSAALLGCHPAILSVDIVEAPGTVEIVIRHRAGVLDFQDVRAAVGQKIWSDCPAGVATDLHFVTALE